MTLFKRIKKFSSNSWTFTMNADFFFLTMINIVTGDRMNRANLIKSFCPSLLQGTRKSFVHLAVFFFLGWATFSYLFAWRSMLYKFWFWCETESFASQCPHHQGIMHCYINEVTYDGRRTVSLVSVWLKVNLRQLSIHPLDRKCSTLKY